MHKVTFSLLPDLDSGLRLAYHKMKSDENCGFVYESAPHSIPYNDVNTLKRRLREAGLAEEIADTEGLFSGRKRNAVYAVSSEQLNLLGFTWLNEEAPEASFWMFCSSDSRGLIEIEKRKMTEHSSAMHLSEAQPATNTTPDTPAAASVNHRRHSWSFWTALSSLLNHESQPVQDRLASHDPPRKCSNRKAKQERKSRYDSKIDRTILALSGSGSMARDVHYSGIRYPKGTRAGYVRCSAFSRMSAFHQQPTARRIALEEYDHSASCRPSLALAESIKTDVPAVPLSDFPEPPHRGNIHAALH